jgi:hypothetical protein
LNLQVECLSDICTADGQRIDPGLQATPPSVLPKWEQDLLKEAKEYNKATPLYDLVQQKEIKLLIVSDQRRRRL